MKLRWLLVPIALAACAHSGSPSGAAAAPMAPAGAACAKVGEHLVGTMPASANAKQDNLDRVAGAMTQSCETDQWSEEAKTCLLAAQTGDALAGCQDKLTPAQIQNMENRTMDAMGARRLATPEPANAPAPAGGPGLVAPSPQPAAPPASRAPRKAPSKPGKAGGDPCDGSE